MKPWNVTPYRKRIICAWCGKSKMITVINVVKKTCSDECRKKRNYQLVREVLKNHPERVVRYRKTYLKNKFKNTYRPTPFDYQESSSLLIR